MSGATGGATPLQGSAAIEVHPYTAWQALRPIWNGLEDACPEASFFLSARWVDTWMAVFGEVLQPDIVIFRDGKQPSGACLLVHTTEQAGPVSLRRMHLNTAGEKAGESPFIEFNGLLFAPGYAAAFGRALAEHAAGIGWDEWSMPGLMEGEAYQALTEAASVYEVSAIEKPSYYVDLQELREAGSLYVDSLRQPSRKHVRQYLRGYAAMGPLRVEVAGSTEASLAMLDELATLHQKSWNERGMPGAFAADRFRQFHRRLIEQCHPAGEILLIRVRAGETTIGVLYSFVYRGKAYFYQSGYDYGINPKLSPGMAVSALAVEHCLENGLAEYDFLAGDAQYKRSLSHASRPMRWVTYRRATMRNRTISLLRSAKHRLSQLRNDNG